MRTHVIDHPLVSHKLTTLRDERTDNTGWSSHVGSLTYS